jgi:hypothetical protein
MTQEPLEPDRPFRAIPLNMAAESTETVQFTLEIPGHIDPESSDPVQLFWDILFDGNLNRGRLGPKNVQHDVGSFAGYLVRDLESGECGVTYQQYMPYNNPKIYSDYRNILPELARELGFDEDQLVLGTMSEQHLCTLLTAYSFSSVQGDKPRQYLYRP